jgi:pimeloyl-ACP methyl ester carboxylesterase
MATLELGCDEYLYYELLAGDRQKPHLVFLHEGLGCTAMWRNFPRLLCEITGCPGLVYDRPGFGRSSPYAVPRTINYLHRDALTWLPAVIAKLLPDAPYFLVGHSDGGSIALIHASERPALLQGIITEAAHVFVEEETLAGIRVAAEAFAAGRLQGLFTYHGEKTEAVFRAWSDTWLSGFFRHWNIEYLLPSIECPILAVQGAEDQYGTVAQVDAIATKAPDTQKAMVAACGHVPHKERTDVVLKLMADFLTSRMGTHCRG